MRLRPISESLYGISHESPTISIQTFHCPLLVVTVVFVGVLLFGLAETILTVEGGQSKLPTTEDVRLPWWANSNKLCTVMVNDCWNDPISACPTLLKRINLNTSLSLQNSAHVVDIVGKWKKTCIETQNEMSLWPAMREGYHGPKRIQRSICKFNKFEFVTFPFHSGHIRLQFLLFLLLLRSFWNLKNNCPPEYNNTIDLFSFRFEMHKFTFEGYLTEWLRW